MSWKTTSDGEHKDKITVDTDKVGRVTHERIGTTGENHEHEWSETRPDGTIKSGYRGENAGSGGGRVICTHFFTKGLLARKMLLAEIQFTNDHIPPAVVRGYHFWAIPYVRLMRRNRLAERVIYPLMKWRGEEIAFQMKLRSTGNLKGKLIRFIGETLCWVIGNFVGNQNWETLWQQEEEQTQIV